MSVTTKFADHGTTIHVLSFDDKSINESLPPAVYSVEFNMIQGFFLKKKGGSLECPDEVFGTVKRRAQKVLTSYQHAEKSFGVLMSGDKGSGKTMTASMIGNRCIEELEIPVVIVEDNFDSAGLASFIESLGECMVFFDEFGKRFDDDDGEQEGLLGLFDGVGRGRRLIVLTENQKRDINQYMINRPGRLHYHFEHGRIEPQVIREYCEKQGVPKDVADRICIRRASSNQFSFDVLRAIVKEYQIFGGEIEDLVEELNIESGAENSTMRMEILSITDDSGEKEFELTPDMNHKAMEAPEPRKATFLEIQRKEGFEENENSFGIVLSVKSIADAQEDQITFVCQENGVNLIIKARTFIQKHGFYTGL